MKPLRLSRLISVQATLAITFSSVLVASLCIYASWRALEEQHLERRAISDDYLSQALQIAWLQHNYPLLIKTLDTVRQRGDLSEAWLLDRDGIIIVSTRPDDIGQLANLSPQRRILPLGDAGQLLIEDAPSGAWELLQRTALLVIASVLLSIFSIVGFVHWRTRAITEGLEDTSRAAERLSVGDFNIKLNGHYVQEVDTIQRTLNFAGTRLQQLTDNLQEQVGLAQQATRAKDSFVANLSHEIRTPMNAVLGYASLLEDSDLNDAQREQLKGIHLAGDALLTLISDILDFARIEDGKLELEAIPFSPRALLSSVLDIQMPAAEAKQLELIGLVDASVPDQLLGDPSRLRQVLLNLVSNAIKFTHQGEVSVRLWAQPQGQTCLLWCEVHDTGIGIPEDVQQKLFSPFQQGDVSTTRRFGGTGLGLSICKRLLGAMGGDISVQSLPGQGARFRFHALLSQPLQATLAPAPPISLQGRRALIIEPNAASRKALATMLSQAGLCVNSTETLPDTPEEADILLIAPSPMNSDPLQQVHIARERPCWRDTPIILLAHLAQRGDAVTAQAAGVNAFLTKPIHQDALLRSIQLTLLPPSRPPSLVTRHHVQHEQFDRKARVLVAEDNPVNQKILVALLEKFSINVDVANNGKEALEAIDHHLYDLVLMDCHMPMLDGLGATRAIRQQARLAKLPIIAVTANAFEEHRQSCLDAGMDDFLTKPITRDALRAMLDQWLPSTIHPPVDLAPRHSPEPR